LIQVNAFWSDRPILSSLNEEAVMETPGSKQFEREWLIVGAIGAFAGWLRKQAAAHDAAAELAGSDPGELSRIAGDLGLSAGELQALASYGPEAANQLQRRMAALHIDSGLTDARLLHDLERLCTLCNCKKRCEADLAHRPEAAVWEQYCPNAETLQELRSSARTPK
jgi:hypothetical protein